MHIKFNLIIKKKLFVYYLIQNLVNKIKNFYLK